jgi:hypothetical protein
MRRKKHVVLKNGLQPDDPAVMAIAEMELYCAAHPRSPSAVRRPSLSVRSGLWIALLGSSVEEGIVGIGETVEAALSAFDRQYLAGLGPPPGKAIRASRSRDSERSAFPKSAPEFRAGA